MVVSRRLLLLLLCVALWLVRGEAGAQAEPNEDPTGLSRRAKGAVEEIVVQARKREEALEATPVSVTALSEATLRESGVTRIDDIRALVPNLQFATSGDGVATDVSIRGIGNPQAAAIAFDPGVGIYVDGVFLPRAIGTLLDVLDVEQIEVLRGPQGTLFGKNTVGGAINITTVKPKPKLEGFALLRPGNLGQVYTQAYLNVPVLEDKVFTRVAVSSTNNQGYVFNRTFGRNYNDRNSLSFLGSIRVLPVDDVTIDVSGSWSRDHNHGIGGQCVYVGGGTVGVLVPGLQEACESSGPFDIATDVAQIADVESYGTWGTIAWEPGAVGPLESTLVKYIGSWREQRTRIRVDIDQTTTNALKRSSVGGSPEDGIPGLQRQISQELQMNGSAWDDRIHLVAGAFGFWETGNDSQTLTVIPDVLDIVSLNVREIDNWSWALYGQATVDLAEWASLTGGVRYTEDKKGLFAENTDPRTDDPPGLSEDDSAVYSAWTPMASLAFSAPDSVLEWAEGADLDHLMVYFTYARGFRGGGFNGVLNPVATSLDQFDPEFIDSFEWGLKAVGFEQRATLNASIFLNDYRDIQVTQQIDVGDIDGDGVPDIQQTTLNGAEASAHGAEIELTAVPIDGLQIRGTVGLLYTRFDDFVGISNVDAMSLDRAGQSFNNAPELQTYLSAQYSFPIEGGDSPWTNGWLTPRLEWYYQSEVHLIGPEVEAGIQPGYNLLHARLSYDFLDDRAQVALWGRNLLDTDYVTIVLPTVATLGIATRYFAMPRTFGGELSYRF